MRHDSAHTPLGGFERSRRPPRSAVLITDLVQELKKVITLQCARLRDYRECLGAFCARVEPIGDGLDIAYNAYNAELSKLTYAVVMREQLRVTKENAILSGLHKFPLLYARLERDDDVREALTQHTMFAATEIVASLLDDAQVVDPLAQPELLVQLAMTHRALPLPFDRGNGVVVIQAALVDTRAQLDDVVALMDSKVNLNSTTRCAVQRAPIRCVSRSCTHVRRRQLRLLSALVAFLCASRAEVAAAWSPNKAELKCGGRHALGRVTINTRRARCKRLCSSAHGDVAGHLEPAHEARACTCRDRGDVSETG
ncbi:MAG: hypothetical protein EOO65_00090 [Methanosarcinales archaeon]|nr:MAG: hypothetical protein EOO65_00090 [Methanosarcinales archaeon]